MATALFCLGLQIRVGDNAVRAARSQHAMLSAAHMRSSAAEDQPHDGEPIKLPENLESLPRADHFPTQRHRWNTNEEIAAILISFDRHTEWQSKEVKIRPKSGSMLLYSRKKVRYRRDGYCWKKRKDGKTTREDHMKLKVQGTECIYGCYVHSAILPTFHRRCYWLLQNPDMVLVHYLNVPYPDDNKLAVITPSLALWADKKEWTKEELVSQLKPMFFSEDEPDLNNELEISTAETVEVIVMQLMEKQRIARSTTLNKQLECGCPDSTCVDGKTCTHPMRRITAVKTQEPRDNNQVTSTTGTNTRHRAGTAELVRHSTAASQHDASPPLVLSLSQIQGGGGLLILNSSTATSHTQSLVTSFVCGQRKENTKLVLKQESMESVSCCRANNNNINKMDVTNGNVFRAAQKMEEVFNYGGGDTVLVIGSTSQAKQEPQPLGTGFFNETLDLSQEDIQRTLSANMPLGQSDGSEPARQEAAAAVVAKVTEEEDLNPMDFIDCGVVSPTQVIVDDDVFVNLDAFDMLGDFPELEILDPPASHASASRHNSTHRMAYREGTANITDYSPEWAYPEGGVKVLVTGPWYSTTSPYTVLFDNQPQATALVQSGVLRCYCPAHEAGLVALQVACEGFIISDSVVFEYKSQSGSLMAQDMAQFSLMRRLEAVNQRLNIKQEPLDSLSCSSLLDGNLEERLVSFCQVMMTRSWRADEVSWGAAHRGMTLLHLAATLGYTRLVCSLLHWLADNSSRLLEQEVDVQAQDDDGNTPLMCACSSGHREAALFLHRYNDTATLSARNKQLHTAVDCARNNGHAELARELEQLTAASARRDGVFLRPGAVSRSEASKCRLEVSVSESESPSPHERSPNSSVGSQQHRLSKRPSVDSGIHLTVADTQASTIRTRDAHKLSRFDRSMSLPLNGGMLDDLDYRRNSPVRRMDFALCEVMATNPRNTGPLLDPDDDDRDAANTPDLVGEQEVRVLTLAEQIIAAMPERIKNESDEDMLLDSNSTSDTPASSLSDVFMEPLLLDEPSDPYDDSEFRFELSDIHNYRTCYYDTPCSSLSPASSMQSPGSFTLDSASPPPTTADFCEFFQASSSLFEQDFSSLTLSDREQRELYEAAKIIQKAYRSYKGRKKREEQDKERGAAVLIQNYYRRYKQYAYFKQMTRAATVIQRSYRERSQRCRQRTQETAAVVRIQNCYRNYRDQTCGGGGGTVGRAGREATPTLKRTYSQRRQHQAARKIQQFMRQSKNKLQKERALAAENERPSAL